MGVGVKTAQLAKVTAEMLAPALQRCESPHMLETARAVGEKLRAECGAAEAVDIITRYVDEEVKTGAWKTPSGNAKQPSAPKQVSPLPPEVEKSADPVSIHYKMRLNPGDKVPAMVPPELQCMGVGQRQWEKWSQDIE